MHCSYLVAFLIVWFSGLCYAELLKDEDVRLKIFSPESAQNSIALELVIFNRDEEFFVKIVSEGGDTICEGKFSRSSADRVKCSYDTNILKDGDNSFHVTIHSVATNELVLDTVSHFFYEAGSIVPSSFSDEISEYWEMAFSILIILLLFRFGPSALRKLKVALFGPSAGGSSPPPPNLPSSTVTLQNFNPLVAAPSSVNDPMPPGGPSLLGGKIPCRGTWCGHITGRKDCHCTFPQPRESTAEGHCSVKCVHTTIAAVDANWRVCGTVI